MRSFSIDLKHLRSLARFLLAQRVRGFPPSESIGLDEEAAPQFLDLLSRSAGYLEFGAGGSTFEAAKRGVRTLSVEGDRYFAKAVRRSLPQGAPVEVIDVNIGFTREWSRPIFTAPTRTRVRRWARYSGAPFARLEELGWFPDLVLVDGRFRRACALKSAREALKKKLKMKLVIDDYFHDDGRDYRAVEEWLGKPVRIGRAAFFQIADGRTKLPRAEDIAAAAADYA